MMAQARQHRPAGATAEPEVREISVRQGSYPADDEKASRSVASKKFELLRRIMADTSVSSIAFRLACLMMWTYRNEKKGGLCCPALETMGIDLNVNEKTIRRSIKELVERSYIKVEKRGKQQSNCYWPIFSDRTPVSNHTEGSDWTFGADVTGHFEPSDRTPVSKESSLEPSLEPRAGFPKPAPVSHSTVDGSGSALRGAPPTKHQHRVTYTKGQEINHPDHGECSIECIARDHLIIRSMAYGVEYRVGRSENGEMSDAPF